MKAYLDFSKFQDELKSCDDYKDPLEEERELFHKIVFSWNKVSDIDFSLISEGVIEKFINNIDEFWDYSTLYQSKLSSLYQCLEKANRRTSCSRRLI